jgi:hypothetical protein
VIVPGIDALVKYLARKRRFDELASDLAKADEAVASNCARGCCDCSVCDHAHETRVDVADAEDALIAHIRKAGR